MTNIKGAVFNRAAPFLILLFLLFQIPLYAADTAGVTVRTEKKRYRPGEPVTVVLENRSGEEIYSLAKSAAPEACIRNFEVKNPRGVWDAFFLAQRLSGSDSDFESAGRIGPQETVSFQWVPSVLIKGSPQPPGSGEFRLSVIYHFAKSGSKTFRTARSNVFTIGR